MIRRFSENVSGEIPELENLGFKRSRNNNNNYMKSVKVSFAKIYLMVTEFPDEYNLGIYATQDYLGKKGKVEELGNIGFDDINELIDYINNELK